MRRCAVVLGLLAGPVVAEGWQVPLPDSPGGLSAIELSEGGTRFTALSDRGTLIFGVLERGQGVLTGARITARRSLEGDIEGLAQSARGLYVSTEGAAPQILRLGADGAPVAQLDLDGLPQMGLNTGAEALAVAPDGALWLAPEALDGGRVALWRYAADRWHLAMTLPADPVMRPVGADFGPDGRLYLLERGFWGLGFSSRLRSVREDGTDLREELRFPFGTHGNLEGVSVWRDGTGQLWATMVEDDNQKPFLSGAIVEYRLR